MKNQYFGDNKDLFKYDLIEKVMLHIRVFKKFIFVPMLTCDDNRKDGNDRDRNKARAGFKNDKLVKFLDEASTLKREERDFIKIKDYFNKQGIRAEIHGHADKKDYFEHSFRSVYFDSITKKPIQETLLFIDPDNGLEISGSKERHLLYSEVRQMYEKLGNNSAIMIIQFFPREDHSQYIKRRSSELKKITSNLALIHDSKIIFFFLTKSIAIKASLNEILDDYQEGCQDTIFRE